MDITDLENPQMILSEERESIFSDKKYRALEIEGQRIDLTTRQAMRLRNIIDKAIRKDERVVV